MVEQLIRNQQVACSSHVSSSMKKPGYPCGSQAFLRSRIILLSVRKAGKEGDKRCPPCRKKLRKRPLRALCGPGRRVGTPAGARTRRREDSPKNQKFSACSKRVSNFDISCVALDDTIKMAKANTIAFR